MRKGEITSPALELLEERRHKEASAPQDNKAVGLIFPSATNTEQTVDLRKPWNAALQSASIEEFRFHDLRHTTAILKKALTLFARELR